VTIRWYFAVDEAGGLGEAGDYAKTAVLTAIKVGGLEPHLIYLGKPTTFTNWMHEHGVKVIILRPDFLEIFERAQVQGTYKAHTLGHWLTIAIPTFERDRDFVLYTDCDVFFLRSFPWNRIQPVALAAAPEFRITNHNYFNAGVMVVNVNFMRETYDSFLQYIEPRIFDGRFFDYDDQVALNCFYENDWESLDPRLNWKPYWDFNPGCVLLHFHGPKVGLIEALAENTWTPGDNKSRRQLAALIEAHADSYEFWLRYVGEFLSDCNSFMSEKMIRTSQLLGKNKAKFDPSNLDLAFMDGYLIKD